MSEQRWPAYQNMCSFIHTKGEEIVKQHAYNLEVYGATESDCRLAEVKEETTYHCGRKVAILHYQLHWTTYLGWKVYMLHTGCMASIPEFETTEILP